MYCPYFSARVVLITWKSRCMQLMSWSNKLPTTTLPWSSTSELVRICPNVVFKFHFFYRWRYFHWRTHKQRSSASDSLVPRLQLNLTSIKGEGWAFFLAIWKTGDFKSHTMFFSSKPPSLLNDQWTSSIGICYVTTPLEKHESDEASGTHWHGNNEQRREIGWVFKIGFSTDPEAANSTDS